jgi:DNA-binding transcriptional ArsR family regulator
MLSAVSQAAHPLPEPLVELVAQRFRVLGEPMRIKLLDRLREGSATVGELQQVLGASQQNVSKHLAILHDAGMVSRTKEGNHARYAISDPGVFELCDQVCGGVRRQLQELETILQEHRQAGVGGQIAAA